MLDARTVGGTRDVAPWVGSHCPLFSSVNDVIEDFVYCNVIEALGYCDVIMMTGLVAKIHP